MKNFTYLLLTLLMTLPCQALELETSNKNIFQKYVDSASKAIEKKQNVKDDAKEGELCDINDPEHCKKTKRESFTYKDLSKNEKKLLDAASAVMKNSYNPYSKFHVGAAVLTEKNEIISGTNFENAAYGSTICAERAAILKANSNGKRKFKTIAIIGRGHSFDVSEPVAPCGACRQVIFECSQIAGRDIKVIMSNSKKSKIYISTIKELLPLAFGPQDLGIKQVQLY